MTEKGKARDTIRIKGAKNGITGEVTGFLGILDNIDKFGEAKSKRKESCKSEKKSEKSGSDKSERSCSAKSGAIAKKGGPFKGRGRKVSVSLCSDKSHHSDKSTPASGQGEPGAIRPARRRTCSRGSAAP